VSLGPFSTRLPVPPSQGHHCEIPRHPSGDKAVVTVGGVTWLRACASRTRWSRAGTSRDDHWLSHPDCAWIDIDYPNGGVAQVAETRLAGQRLVVRRTRLVGVQATLWPDWRYHAFITDREGGAVTLDANHRRHAVSELAIHDLKDGVGLRHCPSGNFVANAAWAVIATLAHNLLRWVAALGLGSSGPVVAKTLRRRLLALPGRLTRSARQRLLHLPTDWPWAQQFLHALARLRAVPRPG